MAFVPPSAFWFLDSELWTIRRRAEALREYKFMRERKIRRPLCLIRHEISNKCPQPQFVRVLMMRRVVLTSTHTLTTV